MSTYKAVNFGLDVDCPFAPLFALFVGNTQFPVFPTLWITLWITLSNRGKLPLCDGENSNRMRV